VGVLLTMAMATADLGLANAVTIEVGAGWVMLVLDESLTARQADEAIYRALLRHRPMDLVDLRRRGRPAV
jgi:hypothetical protein